MRSCLGILLFFFIVLPMVLGALVLFAVNTWVFDRDFYIETLDNVTLYEVALEDLPNYFDAEAFQREFSDFEQEKQANAALALAFAEVVSPEYLRGQVVGVIDDVFEMLDNPNDSADIAINLLPIKEDLLGEQSADFARVLAENLPQCAEGQEPRGPDDVLISCRSQSLEVEDATAMIERALPTYVETIPNELTLDEDVDGDAVPLSSVSIRAGYRSAMIVMGLFALLIWLLVAFVAGRGMRGNLLWLGVTLLIPAGIVFGIGGAMAGLTDEIRAEIDTNTVTINNIPASERFQTALEDSFIPAFTRVGEGFSFVGGIAAGLSIALLFFGLISPRPYFDERYVNVPQPPPRRKNDEFY